MLAGMDRADLVRLRRVRDRMDRDYARPLDVTALARDALMSPGHLSRSFRAAFGETHTAGRRRQHRTPPPSRP
jgi:transcriptional regulator GlxA family with amidase domain